MTVDDLLQRIDRLEERLTALRSRNRELREKQARLRDDVDALNVRITAMEARKARKPKTLQVSEAGTCGLNPEINSAVCPNSSLYRFQQGCLGTACVEKNRQYYADRRAKKKSEQQA